jgi:hypothetical protein
MESLIGTIRGRTIELEHPPQVADGAVVRITIDGPLSCETSTEPAPKSRFLERAAELSSHWTAEDDAIFDEIQASRKTGTRGELAP